MHPNRLSAFQRTRQSNDAMSDTHLVGQSVGRYAATLEICDARAMSLMLASISAPSPPNSMVAVSSTFAVVQDAVSASSSPLKLTPGEGFTRTY